jgi:hypothetical protein
MVKCGWCKKTIWPFIQIRMINNKSGQNLHTQCFGERENAIIEAMRKGDIKKLERVINNQRD